MKRTFILFAAIAGLFAACKKANKDYTHCYVCQGYDSTVYNIPPYLITGLDATDTLCGQSDATIAYYMKTHSNLSDTLYHKHDTLIIKHLRIADCAVP